MATIVNDLVTKFSYLGSEKPLEKYNFSLGSSIKLLGGVVLGLEAAAGAFSLWADSQLRGIDTQAAFAKQTGVSVAAMQEWTYAAEQTQSSGQAVQSTFAALTANIGRAAQQGSEEFARLGISVRDSNGQVKSADRILGEVSTRFKQLGLSLAEQKHFAEALGIDSSLLQLLGKTGGELANLRQEARDLGVLTEEQAKQAEDYTKSVNSMWFGLNSIKQLVAVGVAPEMRAMADEFVTLLKNNKDWIVAGIKTTVKWVGAFLGAINRLLPVFAALGTAFLVGKIAALGFTGAMGVLFSPVVLITAGIIALLAIVDDLIVAFHGGKSVIADFFKDTFDIDIVEGMTKAFDVLKIGLDVIVLGFKQWWGYLKAVVQLIRSGGAAIGRFFGLGAAGAPQMPGNAPVEQFAIPPAGKLGGGGSVDNRQVNQTVTQNIYTSDAAAAGQASVDGLQKQLSDAETQLRVGGR